MLLRNIEFYNTPSGEVVISEIHKPIRVLEESNTELINELLDIIRDRFPLAYKRLSENYTKSEKSIAHYNYRMVKWKIAAEKATLAEWNVPLKNGGDNLLQKYDYFSFLRKAIVR